MPLMIRIKGDHVRLKVGSLDNDAPKVFVLWNGESKLAQKTDRTVAGHQVRQLGVRRPGGASVPGNLHLVFSGISRKQMRWIVRVYGPDHREDKGSLS